VALSNGPDTLDLPGAHLYRRYDETGAQDTCPWRANESLRFFLLPFLLAAACTDAPTAPTGLTPPTSIAADAGNPPPPPVDATAVVCAVGCVAVDGEYFSNGDDPAAAAIGAETSGEGVCTFDGSAWLNFDKKQDSDAAVSANGRIKCSHLIASGTGTIEYASGLVVVNLDPIVLFNNIPECTTFCGNFLTTATVFDAETGESREVPATGAIFNREFYDKACPPITVCDPLPPPPIG